MTITPPTHARKALIFIFVLLMPSASLAQTSDLVGMLTQQLGVSKSQATGGLGALLSSAQQHMSSEDIASLGEVIPDMSSLIAAAPAISEKSGDGGGSSLMSMAGGMLGEKGDQMQYLSGAFDSLGLDSKMIAQYSKLLLQFVESEGGQALKKSLQSALMGG